MSQHSSLRSSALSTRHRNVLKRYERIKKLVKDDRWKEGMPVFGLPKVKSIKIKVKKLKAETKTAAGTEGAAPAEAKAQAPQAPAKGAAPAKGGAGKPKG